MPFLQEGDSVEAGFVSGPVGYGLPAAELVVDPNKIIELRNGFENELKRVRDWFMRNQRRLASIDPPGGDPCSGDTAAALGENGQSALDAARGYVDQLEKVAFALNEIANAYGLREQENTRTLGHAAP